MYTLEYIIHNKLPLTDYQQLILDCRVTSERIIKQKCFFEDTYYLNHQLYRSELISQFNNKENTNTFSYMEFVDNIKNRLNKFKDVYGDVDISYNSTNERELSIIINNCKTISIPYRFIGRILTDNGWYVDACNYIKDNKQVLIHIAPYIKTEHISFDELKYKPINLD